MALTYSVEVGTGTSQVYNIRWESKLGLLDRSHVFVYAGDDYTQNQIPFTWVNDGQIQCAATGTFRIRRVVPRNKAWNDYADGAIMREKNLDDSYAQPLMIQEEITDGYLAPNGDQLMNQPLDMANQRIKRVGVPIDPKDAVSKDITDGYANRILGLETSLPLVGAQYIAHVVYDALGGETEIETNYNISHAQLSINSGTQTLGRAFNILGTKLILAEALEEDDEVSVVLTVPFLSSPMFSGTGDWLFTAVGGETSVDVGLAFTGILLSLNGSIQTPTRAFSVLGTVLTFAEPLEEDDTLYAMLSA